MAKKLRGCIGIDLGVSTGFAIVSDSGDDDFYIERGTHADTHTLMVEILDYVLLEYGDVTEWQIFVELPVFTNKFVRTFLAFMEQVWWLATFLTCRVTYITPSQWKNNKNREQLDLSFCTTQHEKDAVEIAFYGLSL